MNKSEVQWLQSSQTQQSSGILFWVLITYTVWEYGKLKARNLELFVRDHFSVVILSLWIWPKGLSSSLWLMENNLLGFCFLPSMYKDDIRLPILSKIPARAGLYMLLNQQIGLVPGRKCNDSVNNCVMVKNSNKNQILHRTELCEGSLRGVSPDNYQRSKVVSTDTFSWTDVSTVFFLFVCSVVILSFIKKTTGQWYKIV
jgi:hypothetical protein